MPDETLLSPKLAAFQRLLTIMDELREQCPWDRKQTLESLRPLTIEETYELADAILEGNMDELKGELGDLFLHLVFYCKIGEERAQFDVAGVLDQVCEKLIRRHPHIYGDVQVQDSEEVKRNWEQIKLREGRKSVLQGVPNSLPAVTKALRVQEKVAQVGFDWPEKKQVWDKVLEEIAEFRAAEASGHLEEQAAEFGDVLFALINYARFSGIDPEAALERTNRKFMYRFRYIEENAPKPLVEMTLAEMDQLWDEAKKEKP
jgi:XTP/dITP diphosphohydrolase